MYRRIHVCYRNGIQAQFIVCRIHVNKLANFSRVHLRAQEQTQAAVSLSLRGLLDRHSTRHPSVPAVEGKLIVRLCTHNVHPHTHPQFVPYCSEREEKGSRASVTHAFGDVYNIILCSGASFPFLLSPNCERAALRLLYGSPMV